eukprot:TRINITY_DN1633_c0_g1_i2.p1 TRINITY_DN1633_c0_g1~~TRINITY_DN1633_c0_g1_i2.p1  ORF type:complete len:380 (-),score=40.58 TRINITY_DN1633_c0_g1_i2:391-1530(-)
MCSKMTKESFKKGEHIINQGQPQTNMYLIASGDVQLQHDSGEGTIHTVEKLRDRGLYGSLHFMRNDPSFATLRGLTFVETYSMKTIIFLSLIQSSPTLVEDIIYSLCEKIHKQRELLRTPLLQQHSKPPQFWATTVAAAIESFYRSGVNSLINFRLTGVRQSLFPNMKIQIPSRAIYINGLKGIRSYLENNINLNNYQYPTLVLMVLAVTPGLAMTPVSSILEACNVEKNKEPLWNKWRRGFAPRAVREVIFGIGLNQLSDYWEERIPEFITSETIKNLFGSLISGVIAGYLSHIPHNLSVLKMFNPEIKYLDHFKTLAAMSENRIPQWNMKASTRKVLGAMMAVVAPRGLVLRTSQLVGSFILLNGVINYLDMHNSQK